MKYIFGPVFSRRLGVSLGVDLVPYKVCSMDCLYCEVGKTSEKTIKRAEYVPFESVKAELEDYLSFSPELDFITFSGYGEPTLYSRLGELVSWLKKGYSYKLALLTNSTLLFKDEVLKDIEQIDIVLPSLDAGSEEVLRKLNRPVLEVTLETVVKGIERLIYETDAEVWLETVFVKGINDSLDEIKRIGELVHRLSPDRWQINTVVRPPAYNVQGLSYEELKRIKDIVDFPETEIIAKATSCRRKTPIREIKEEIVSIVSRRPCPISELADALNVLEEEVKAAVSALVREGKVKVVDFGGEPYIKGLC